MHVELPMRQAMPRLPHIALGTALLATLVATIMVGRAATASNVIVATRAGVGSATVGNYSASTIGYQLNANEPYNVDAVTFTLSPAQAASVRIVLNGTPYACSNVAGAVTCATTSPQALVVASPTLQVVAAT